METVGSGRDRRFIGSGPIFVLCTARSGSTLLRLLLDAHPSLFCPGETNLANIVGTYRRTFSMAYGDDSEMDPSSLTRMRELVEGLIESLAPDQTEIRHWCDKSLVSWEQADLLLKVWPDAKFVCLYRHVMDFIASAVETSPWGFRGYGFPGFIARSPDNFPLALATYWLERTTRTVEFAKQHPDICCEIRYEDLVTDPETVALGLWKYLEIEPQQGLTDGMFENSRPRGVSDYKIWHTKRVLNSSIGRGSSVPIEFLPPQVCNEMNRVLRELEYQQITKCWGSYGAIPHLPIQASDGGRTNGDPTDQDGSVKTHSPTPTETTWIGDELVLDNRCYREDADVERIIERSEVSAVRLSAPVELLVIDGVFVLHSETISPADYPATDLAPATADLTGSRLLSHPLCELVCLSV